MALSSINPATGETLATFETLSPADVSAALDRAVQAFQSWRQTSFEKRAELLTNAAGILEAESEWLGRLMTSEMGKPLRAGIDEALEVRARLPLLRRARGEAFSLTSRLRPRQGRPTSATNRSAPCWR